MATTINMTAKNVNTNNESTKGVSQSFVTPWGTDPERYWERPDYAKAIAKTALDQLACSGLEHFGEKFPSVLASWGVFNNVQQKIRTKVLRWREMPAVAMHVDGFAHSGWVIISLDEGMDEYEVECADEQFFAKEGSRKDGIFFDMLAEVIDESVETGGLSQEEYEKKIEEADPLMTWAVRNGVKQVVVL